ncbi:MAG: hypothetical protein A2359_01290 [Candidatus Moranbacteria bacterium RIFOXYB1_FULL_43_19]|nr:MAG: hypothetical protein A2359_01290 [Candidatus Moranbacteria bacterium RIFOXYB1_FULL_43_19]
MTTSLKKRREREYQAKIRDVLICSKGELAPFATAFSFPPENFEQHKFGTLFGIIKVDDHSEDSSYVVNLLTSVIKKEYFGKPHRSPEDSFEASLRKANLALAELVRHGATKWAGKISFCGGAIERNNLHFACLGKASIFLIRGGEIAEISAELEEEKEAESHPLKTFSNTSSGKLEIGDKLIFATQELTDIFSREELRQNASHFSSEEFPGFLEISLRANSELAGAIVVDLIDSADLKPLVVEAPAVGREKAPKYAKPEPATAAQAKKIDSFVGTKSLADEEKRSRDLENALREEAPTYPKPAWKNIFLNFLEKTKDIFHSLSNSARKINFRKYFGRIPALAKSSVSAAKPFFASLLSKTKKVDWRNQDTLAKFAAGIIILAIISFGAVAFVKNRNEQKRLAAETAAQPAETAPDPQSLEDINVRNIETLEEVANLPQENIDLAVLDGVLYAISGKDRSMTKIDVDSKSTEEAKSDLSSGNFGLLAAMPNLKALFALTEDKKVISFTPINKNFQENSISLPSNLKARDIKSYLTYLYILDIDGNQIYRYPRAEGGFGEGQNWLRTATDLKNAKGMAINGDLYLAEGDKITAYLQGKIDGNINFEKPSVPLLIDKIFSEPDMEGVYVLDNKNRRIVKFGKDGKIVSQYWNADISSVKDFSVDEKNKVVYLLKKNQLLKFSIE